MTMMTGDVVGEGKVKVTMREHLIGEKNDTETERDTEGDVGVMMMMMMMIKKGREEEETGMNILTEDGVIHLQMMRKIIREINTAL